MAVTQISEVDHKQFLERKNVFDANCRLGYVKKILKVSHSNPL